MKTSRFLLGVVAILCFACAKPEINVEPELVVPDGAIIGTFEKIVTKASFGSDMSFLWSEEDAIKVLTNKSTREFVLASGAGQSTASFAGSMGSDETLGNVLAFPYDAVNTLTATSVEFNLPSQYTYTQPFTFGNGSDASVVLPCYATIEGKNFTVKHLGGYIVYEISNIPATATKFILKTTNGKRINGVFSADLTANPAMFAQADAANESEQTVEIRFQAGTSTTQCFIIPVPQGEYSWVWDMYTEADKKVGHGRQDATTVGRNCIVGQREQCATLGDDEDDPQGGDEDGIPDYIENGVNLGKGIAVLGDWNEDGNQTTLYWAPVNCGYEEVGEVNTRGDHRLGKLYQWGAGDSSLLYYDYDDVTIVGAREMYYDTPTPSPWYDDYVIYGTTADTWNNNQGPCPDGWRLPTSKEFKVLCVGKNGNYGWVSAGTYAGQINTYKGAEFFGDNSNQTSGEGVFFPAAGGRKYSDGDWYNFRYSGHYWSSTSDNYSPGKANYLFFEDSTNLYPQYVSVRASAYSVRCVSEGSDSESETEPEPQEIPSYTENGANLGKGIAVLGDWNNDGTETTLYWAPVNCGYKEVGEVNTNSDHRFGKLYQWGAGDSSLPYKYNGSPVVAREMYYDTTTPYPWYDYDTICSTTLLDKWNNNQGPCPEGWRLPTAHEFIVLCAGKNGSYGWVLAGTYASKSNKYPGAEFFGANSDKTAGKGVFFPAAGYRDGDDGSAYVRGSDGVYWSSTSNSGDCLSAYSVYFCSSYLRTQYDYRANAFSVRCVTE